MKFIFDENFSFRFADGLNVLESGNKHSKILIECWHVISLGKELGIKADGASYTDLQVVQMAKAIDGIILTQDDDFKRIKHQYPLFKEHGVGIIYFKTYKESRGYWNMVVSLITKWEGIKDLIMDIGTPFCFFVDKKGIQRRDF